MSVSFDAAFLSTLNHEGGLSDHPSDRGGLTKYGITAATWQAYCNDVQPSDRRSVRDITLEDAKSVYRRNYWDSLGLDSVDAAIAAEVFDTAVNCGVGTAARLAQRAFNLIRIDGATPLLVDGKLGPITRARLNEMVRLGYRQSLLGSLNAYQAIHYIDIVERNPSQRVFIRGWMKRCAGGA